MKQPWHHSRVLATPLTGVFATYSASGQHFSRHWHDAYGFGLMVRGAQSWVSGRGRVDAYAGDVITTNPGEVHDGRPLGAPTRHWRIVSVDPRLIRGDIARPVIEDGRLAAALKRLFAAIERWNVPDRSDAAAMSCEEAFADSCGFLFARHGSESMSRGPATKKYDAVRDRLSDELRAAPTLAELAAMMDVSRFTLVRGFTRQFGLPPHAWLTCRRAERARALIRSGETLAQAATLSGFADQSHMTRTFVRHFGYTPGTWARAQ